MKKEKKIAEISVPYGVDPLEALKDYFGGNPTPHEEMEDIESEVIEIRLDFAEEKKNG